MLQNFIANPPTFRPATIDCPAFLRWIFFGDCRQHPIHPDLIYNSSYSNTIVTNIYAAYSAQIDFLPIIVPVVPQLSITNSQAEWKFRPMS